MTVAKAIVNHTTGCANVFCALPVEKQIQITPLNLTYMFTSSKKKKKKMHFPFKFIDLGFFFSFEKIDRSSNLCSAINPLIRISHITCLDIYNWSVGGLQGQYSLTQEVKLLWEEVKQDAGVHGEEDSEVSPQRTPHKEMVNSCPVSCVQRDLHIHIQKRFTSCCHKVLGT